MLHTSSKGRGTLLIKLLIGRGTAMFRKVLFTGAALALFASSGFAADLPMKAPMYVPPPVYDWTGFYIGGNAGWGWSTSKSLEIAPGSGAFPVGTVFTPRNSNGWLGGVQAGYNYQAAPNFVVGVEGEYTWSDITGTSVTVSTVPRFAGFTSISTGKLTDFALGTVRLGYAAGNWLFYGKGGIAWGQSSGSGIANNANGTLFDTSTHSSNSAGWVVGIGTEWGFAPGWSARIEYDHIGFESRNVLINGTASLTNTSSASNVDLVRGGLNYRFNWGAPLVAKY
jgi:outer membrane immunogenic protein